MNPARALALAAVLLARAALADTTTAAAPQHGHAEPHVPTNLEEWARGAQIYPGLGEFHRPVSAASAQAQAYFDQGMRFLWAFNHDEATRSFAQAARLDPQCAACYWGVALTVGPNYNLTSVDALRTHVAREALSQARAHAAGASPVEQALIAALAARYPDEEPASGAAAAEAQLAAYAQAMEAVAARFPEDDDVQVMTAEAEMTVHAWKLWTSAGQPIPGTTDIEGRLERVLKRNPQHPGANHYYVHLMEASPTPEAALAAAQKLQGMMPAAGHLEHMPAHIMQRVGRYEEAAEANRRGVAADRAYLASTSAPDYYAMYLAHNSAFLAYSAAMEGRKAETLVAVQDLAATLPAPMLVQMKDSGWAIAAQYAALVRFGLWDELIALVPPDPRLPGATAGYLYGRGVGLAARGQMPAARQALGELEQLAHTAAPDAQGGMNPLSALMAVAVPVLAARIAATERRDAEAIALLEQAVAAEDQLAYDEPADWFFPTRHLLGAQLLLAGQPAAAERVLREDLKLNPDNGWALFGLAAALRAEGHSAQAARIDRQQAHAWRYADVRLPGAAFWYAGFDAASCECQHFSSQNRQTRGVLFGAQNEAGIH